MSRIRRLYFYLVLYVGLAMVLTGLGTLGRVLLEQALGTASSGVGFGLFAGREQFREQTAFGIALTVIGLAVWLLHWRAVRGWLAGPDHQAERTSGLRRLYIYGALLTTALTAYVSTRDLLEHLIGQPLGLSTGSQQSVGVARALPYVLIAGLFWTYHWRVAATDRALVGEVGAGATLRRWYVYLMAALGAVPLMVNLTSLGQQAWVAAFDQSPPLASLGPSATLRTVAASGATVLVALVVWLAHRGWSEAAAATRQWHGENERHSVHRKVYLYGLVLGTVGWALVSASQVLNFAIVSLLGVAPETVAGQPVLVALGRPLVSVLVFGLFWAFYWRSVNREAAAEAEVGRQAGVRRVYFYLVSAISLGFLAASTAGLLRLLADVLLQGALVDPNDLRRSFATDLSRLAVALPIWLFHWGNIQARVRGDAGGQEASATTRRWYLYIVAFAAVAVLLFSGARIVYELVVAALGDVLDAGDRAEISHLLADTLVAATLLWYHWWLVLRADIAMRRQTTEDRVAVAVIAGLDASGVEALQGFVRDSLDGARVRLFWTDEAHARAAIHRVSEPSSGKAV